MINEPIFTWDEETKTASCILTDGEEVYMGLATCHPDDTDLGNEKTGYEIAFRRASIYVYKHYRDELKLQLKTLKHLHSTMKHSKYFNPKSYENRMLQRHIRMFEFDLTTIKETIATEEQNLRKYIKEKDDFYVKTRARREMRNKKANNN